MPESFSINRNMIVVGTVLGPNGVVAVESGFPVRQRDEDLGANRPVDLARREPPAAVVAEGAVVPGDGGGGIFYWDAICEFPDDGGTIINPNINRSLQGRWRRIYSGALNVKWFGAQLNNTDDTIAFQNALRVLNRTIPSLYIANGGRLFVPAGRAYLSASLRIPSGTEIFGDGRATVLQFKSQTDGLQCSTPSQGITIRDMQLYYEPSMPPSEGDSAGVRMDPVSSIIRVRNVYFYGWQYSISVDQGESIWIDECSFNGGNGDLSKGIVYGVLNSDAVGIWLKNTGPDGGVTNNIAITRCNFNSPAIGIRHHDGLAHTVSDCTFESPTTVADIINTFEIAYLRCVTGDGHFGSTFKVASCSGLRIEDSFFYGSSNYPFIEISSNPNYWGLQNLRISNLQFGVGSLALITGVVGDRLAKTLTIEGFPPGDSKWIEPNTWPSTNGSLVMSDGVGINTAMPEADLDILIHGDNPHSLIIRDGDYPHFQVAARGEGLELATSYRKNSQAGIPPLTRNGYSVLQAQDASGMNAAPHTILKIPVDDQSAVAAVIEIVGRSIGSSEMGRFRFDIAWARYDGDTVRMPSVANLTAAPSIGRAFPSPMFLPSVDGTGIDVKVSGATWVSVNWQVVATITQRC